MPKLLTQVIYDIGKNTKLKIYTDPRGGDMVDGDSISSSGVGSMVKFYPSGSREIVTYELETLSHDVPLPPEENITYIGQVYPTSSVYSLLNDTVEYKPFSQNSDDVLLGTLPNIVSITYSAASERTLLQQFGMVYKDTYYQQKLNMVRTSLGNEHNYALRFYTTLNSISTNRSQQNLTIYATGQVLCPWSEYKGGTIDAYVEGIQYKSKGFDINYYNQTIIPIKVLSTIDSTSHDPVQNPDTEGDGEGGFTKKSFTTTIRSEDVSAYLYYGEDPLQLKRTVSTYMQGETIVDQESFLVLALLDKNDQFQRAFIANKKPSSSDKYKMAHYKEYTHNNYQTVILDNARFYRQTSVAHSRQEDCLTAKLADTNIIYPCTKGAGTWSGLSTIITYMESDARDTLFESAPELSDGDYDNYVTKRGNEMVTIKELIGDSASGIIILSSLIGVQVKRERLERSVTKMVPLGRNMSHRTLYSERVGETNSDFDSKEYIGGALPLKTYTLPTYTAKATAGDGDTIQNVGYGNAVYFEENDVQVIADNFELMNNNLNHVSVTFKGAATIDDLENVIEGDYILDNVNWDIGRHTTTFSCRTVFFN